MESLGIFGGTLVYCLRITFPESTPFPQKPQQEKSGWQQPVNRRRKADSDIESDFAGKTHSEEGWIGIILPGRRAFWYGGITASKRRKKIEKGPAYGNCRRNFSGVSAGHGQPVSSPY
jgi:hypothetical protein